MSSKNIKRQPERFPVDMPARFRSADSKGPWSEGMLVNLSEGGLCLKTDMTLLPGEMLEIAIDSKDKKGVERSRLVRAKVVWRKEGKVGVQFMRSRALTGRPPARKTGAKEKPSKPKLVVTTGGKPKK